MYNTSVYMYMYVQYINMYMYNTNRYIHKRTIIHVATCMYVYTCKVYMYIRTCICMLNISSGTNQSFQTDGTGGQFHHARPGKPSSLRRLLYPHPADIHQLTHGGLQGTVTSPIVEPVKIFSFPLWTQRKGAYKKKLLSLKLLISRAYFVLELE